MKTRILSLLLCLAATAAAWAQTTVTGVVYEPSGETAIGATVFEKGNPSGGTSTGIDGDFSLKVSSSNATIVVSYIGMETQEIALAGRSKVEIRLKDAGGVNLDEIVVVGYGTQKKINATGAVKTIDNSVLESRPLTNAVQGLQGAVAGLNITNDAGGAPGEAMNINIRGVGSIGEGSSSSPLVLIDGMEGDLATLNPNDIANISVLKDAAAASIYGSRAPFGVILVTTKGGDKATRVNYSGNVRFSKPISVPEPLDALTYALVTNEAIDNSGVGGNKFSQGVISRIRRYMAGELPYGTEPVETAGQDDWKGNLQAFGNTNWYDVHLKDHTFSQEHNVSVSGGGDKVTYYLSGNLMDQTGLFRYADEDYKRLSVSGKFNIKFNDYVSLTWTTRYINVNNDKPSAMTGLFFHNLGRINPTNPVTLPNGEYNKQSLIQSLQDGGQTVQKTNQFYNQGNLLIEPIKSWQIHADIASRLEFNPYTRQFNPISYTGPQGSQKWLNVLPGVNDAGIYSINTNGTFRVLPGAGHSYYEKAQTNIQYFSTNIYTDYTLDIARDHHFKFLAGVQTEYFKNDITRTASTNILIPDTPFLPSDKGDASTMISEAKGEWSSVGIFGRINYNYADRYMIEANLRGDAASRFPSDQRWGVFPSFSAGWNIAQENFWENLRYAGIEYLKLRGSYGVLGNQNTTSFYPYYQQMAATPGQVIIGGNQATVLPMYAPYSTSLTWEKIENVGAGIDLGLFNNRLTGAFDWYQRTTKDMVGPALALAGIYGADAPKTNNAELRTRGWEVEIAWRDRIGKDFSYGISASLSDYQTEITKYDSPDNKINGWYQGKNYGDIWGYRVVGIAKSDAEMAAYLAQHDQSALGNYWGGGDLMYANLDGDPAISPGASTLDNPGDQTVIGNTTPRYAYSFTLEAQWRWIDFRAYFQGIGKRDYYVGESTFYGFGGGQYQCTL
ncbi:MAG: SusC/RagA family TonB-linked outer membrane protein, partial [Muribaculaceae bacterium]|nr:SusC/RagA family TonB-linked outer membrane protein [Muribaculaceae bacterium]